MSKFLPALGFIALGSFLTTHAQADLITWGAVQNATGPAEVSLNGTLVTARNCWNTTAASPTVNGVLFAAFGPTGWGNGGNLLMNGSTSGDAAYDTLITTSRATTEATVTNPTGWGGIRIDNLGTLTLGNTYEIQVWFSDQRPGTVTNQLNDRVMTYSSATGPASIGTTGIVSNLGSLTQGPLSGPLEADPNNVSGAGDTIFGQYVIGTFTRTSTDQIWLLAQGTHPVSTIVLRPNVNAFQIREVPSSTPSTPECTGDTVANCPCSGPGGSGVPNPGATGNGCANSSFPAGALLTSSGFAVDNAGDTLVLTCSNIPGPGLFFQSNNTTSLINFGDGRLCAAVGIIRLGVVFPTAGVASYPGGLTPNPIHIAGAPVLLNGSPTPETKHYQCWYRDITVGFCNVEGYNLSNGLALAWAP